MTTGVEFDEDKFSYSKPTTQASSSAANVTFSRPAPPSGTPKMAVWLMKHGITKSSGSAQAILVAVVILNIIVTFVVINFFIL